MTFNEYKKEVMVTWNNRGLSFEQQFTNAVLGLAELGEYWWASEENANDELGDLLYYTTILVNLFNVDVEKDMPKVEYNPFYQIQHIFLIQGYAKKVTYHLKPLEVMVEDIVKCIKILYAEFFSADDVEDVMQQNIDKLRKRHGNSFQYNTN